LAIEVKCSANIAPLQWFDQALNQTLELGSHHMVYLYNTLSILILKKSSWKKQVQLTGFLVYFQLKLYCLCKLQKSIWKLIFAG
jgi:hypothetical protein